MRSPFLNTHIPSRASIFAMLICVSGIGSIPSYGQMGMAPAAQTQGSSSEGTQAQLTQLRSQVAQLQEALQKERMRKPGSGSAMPAGRAGMNMPMGNGGEMGGMSGGSPKPPMGPMKRDGGEMTGMAPSPGGMNSGSGKPMGGKGCCGMSMGKPMAMSSMSAKPSGGMGPMNQKPMSSANAAETPLLHIGAKDFFLDHATHLMLSADQRASLESIKSNATQQKAASENQVDQAQQELWQLTSADQPDGGQIDTKVQQIAALNANEQIAFIHSVVASSAVLTPDQRAQVVMPTAPAKGMKSQMRRKSTTAPTPMQ